MFIPPAPPICCCICIAACTNVWAYICMWRRVSVCVCVCMYVCLYVCVCVCTCVQASVSIFETVVICIENTHANTCIIAFPSNISNLKLAILIIITIIKVYVHEHTFHSTSPVLHLQSSWIRHLP